MTTPQIYPKTTYLGQLFADEISKVSIKAPGLGPIVQFQRNAVFRNMNLSTGIV